MDDETIHLLFSLHHDAGPVVVFEERSEEYPPVIGKLALPLSVYQRLGKPESLSVQLKRVL